jgi:ubiquinone/menaquinone biosynthesis C-methylase UbiE
MKTHLEFLDADKLWNPDWFNISCELYLFQKKVKEKTGILMQNAEHATRRYEYPWAYQQTTGGTVCLDAGGGTNPFSFLLAEKYTAKVVMLDNDEHAIHNMETIRRAFPVYKHRILNDKGDIRNIPYHDGFFDDVFCISVLEHIPHLNIPRALHELLRVTKHKLVITVDAGDNNTETLSFKDLTEILRFFKHDTTLVSATPTFITIGSIEHFTVACITVEKEAT